ncbi:MAG: polyprenyl synthetase family protein [Pseudomonadales bacterium]|nr:polyprenyl synthetase family protein [Pseudomonadales bacterium]MBO6566427.1 polyprenyl synthetase family protein [Pseudomonadales bacterium]MBO6595421.1 polyprenyl synthetase family protein [Pseudomonadales bacterium]MBO6657576.1 polyprenyl synthetase family protein [Pseudomonadales bacterium]MBO6701921.1 polyprenyl synthetase family protein [Pseudomonadales bacterium]
MTATTFHQRVDAYRHRVEQVIVGFLDRRFEAGSGKNERLESAVRYAANTTGKRIRALLSYATAEALSLSADVADQPAAAIELLHIYSLVHDDLPAMDDDDLRRGQPTVHKQFDEATAVLVGDALLTYAFELLSEGDIDPGVRIQWVSQLSRAGGAQGMINGQAVDLEGETRVLSLEELKHMHRQKSGALIEASIDMVAAAAEPTFRECLQGFGHHIGLAFQIRDDILDVQGTTEELGKPQGSDTDNNKSTFVSLLGLNAAHDVMHEELQVAKDQLDRLEALGQTVEGLRWVSDYIIHRRN